MTECGRADTFPSLEPHAQPPGLSRAANASSHQRAHNGPRTTSITSLPRAPAWLPDSLPKSQQSLTHNLAHAQGFAGTCRGAKPRREPDVVTPG